MVKLRSKKFMMITVAGLAALSVGSVAFASWVLGQQTYTANTGNVSVTVGSVTDNRLTVSVTMDQNDNSVAFDSDGSRTEGTIGALDTSTTNSEDLTFAFTISITHTDTSINPSTVIDKVEFTLGGLKSYIDGQYIVSPFSDTAVTIYSNAAAATNLGDNVTITPSETTPTLTIAVKVTFAWGTAFSSANPSKLEATEANITALKTFSGLGTTPTVTGTVTVTTKSA